MAQVKGGSLYSREGYEKPGGGGALSDAIRPQRYSKGAQPTILTLISTHGAFLATSVLNGDTFSDSNIAPLLANCEIPPWHTAEAG